MLNSTFLKLSEVTLSDQFHATESKDHLLLHAAMGLQTEIGEMFAALHKGQKAYYLFDRVNFLEEVGDALWYLAIPQRLFECDLEERSVLGSITQAQSHVKEYVKEFAKGEADPLSNLMYCLNQDTTEFLDIMKKRIFYGRVIDQTKLDGLLSDIYDTLFMIAALMETDLGPIMDKIIKKLNARYGDKFSSFMANNRDLDAEYTILSAPATK